MGSLELDTEETDVNAVSALLPCHAQWRLLPCHAQLVCDVRNACCSSWPVFSSSLVVKGQCQDWLQVMVEMMQVRLGVHV